MSDTRTCDGCGRVEDAGAWPDQDGRGYSECCSGEVEPEPIVAAKPLTMTENVRLAVKQAMMLGDFTIDDVLDSLEAESLSYTAKQVSYQLMAMTRDCEIEPTGATSIGRDERVMLVWRMATAE